MSIPHITNNHITIVTPLTLAWLTCMAYAIPTGREATLHKTCQRQAKKKSQKIEKMVTYLFIWFPAFCIG